MVIIHRQKKDFLIIPTVKKLHYYSQKLISNIYFPIICLILFNVILGYNIVTDFGESRDEILRYRYATKSFSAYLGDDSPGTKGGPFYIMLAKVGSDFITTLHKDWNTIDAWHFIHLLSFLMGIFFLYLICLQFVGKWAAFGAVLLFNSQPLLFGHAFINPKDIPFMSFFIASVATGLIMVQSLMKMSSREVNDFVSPKDNRELITDKLNRDWRGAPRSKRLIYLAISALSIGLIIGLILADGFVREQITLLIQQAYNAEPSSLLGAVFNRMTENVTEIPVENYVQKGLNLFPRIVLIFVGMILVLNGIIGYSLFPGTTKWIWNKQIKPFFKKFAFYFTNIKVVEAGIFLGLCSSIRVLGPASGFLIGVYLLLKRRRNAIPILLAYFVIAFITTYITWPALWDSPFNNYILSFSEAADFPWVGKVIFAGEEYSANALPRSYLPALISLQLTESAVLAFLVGLIVAAIALTNRAIDRQKLFVITLWLFAPVIAVMVLQPTMYGNFRHFLFIVPPIFIYCSIGLQGIFERIKVFPAYILLLIILVLPNIYWNVSLHPYEYVYYNSAIGGVRGAFRNYELDYWTTSYKEATEYINMVSPKNANVVVWGPNHIVERYARDDLNIQKYHQGDEKDTPPGTYVIISTRLNKDIYLYPMATQLFQTGRDGAIFAVVKVLDPANPP